VDALIDPSMDLQRRLGPTDAHDARLARLTSVSALPSAPALVNGTRQFKPETLPRHVPFFAPEEVVHPPPPDAIAAAAAAEATADAEAAGGWWAFGTDALLASASPVYTSCGANTAAAAAASSISGGGSGSNPTAVAPPSPTSPPSPPSPPLPEAASTFSEVSLDATSLGLLTLDGAGASFAFDEPPEWLVAAAAAGCHTLADVAACTSLEHQGPIDALEQEPAVLAEYARWLLAASKRADYLKERVRETERERAVAERKHDYAQRGAALQQAAWRQRGAAAEERQKLVAQKQIAAKVSRKEAQVRSVHKQWRDAAHEHYTRAVHSEVAESNDHARAAKAHVARTKLAGARTIKAAAGAIERRRVELQGRKEAEARAVRDRVRAATMVHVPAELAASINSSASFTGSFRGDGAASPPKSCEPAGGSPSASALAAIGGAGGRVLRNPDSVLAMPRAGSRGGAGGGETVTV
jgi:hypothetical protein